MILTIILFWIMTIPIGIIGSYLFFRFFPRKFYLGVPLTPLWLISIGIGFVPSGLLYILVTKVWGNATPFLPVLLVLDSLIVAYLFRKYDIRPLFSSLQKEIPFIVFSLALIFFFTLFHKTIGADHIEMHAPLAEAIQHGHLPVKNASKPHLIGVDVKKLNTEIRYFQKRKVIFPFRKFELDKPISYHYIDPILLSMFRAMTYNMTPYPLIQLSEMVLCKIIILAALFLLLFDLTQKIFITGVALLFFLFSGSWAILARLPLWIKMFEKTSVGYHRMLFASNISFGYPPTILRYPVMLFDFVFFALLLLGAYFLLQSKRPVFFITCLFLIFVPFMLLGTGYILISVCMILVFLYFYDHILIPKYSSPTISLITIIISVFLSIFTVQIMIPVYNAIMPANLLLEPKPALHFQPWESPEYFLKDLSSWVYLFVQTGNLFIFIPLATLWTKGRYQSLIHSMLLASVPLVVISLKFSFGENYPGVGYWDMTKFWSVSFFYGNIILAIAWSAWMTNNRLNHWLKIILSLPLYFATACHLLFLSGIFQVRSFLSFDFF
ncbi:MAG: hypothetical protein GY797_37920 [Deltaproteobacteria bacterium]|nr:hypothetical protein [Deltaproteobacteria bacterium]